MLIREFCDRCGKEVTGQQSGAINGVDDADRNGDGTVTHIFNVLCLGCYQRAIDFLRSYSIESESTAAKETQS